MHQKLAPPLLFRSWRCYRTNKVAALSILITASFRFVLRFDLYSDHWYLHHLLCSSISASPDSDYLSRFYCQGDHRWTDYRFCRKVSNPPSWTVALAFPFPTHLDWSSPDHSHFSHLLHTYWSFSHQCASSINYKDRPPLLSTLQLALASTLSLKNFTADCQTHLFVAKVISSHFFAMLSAGFLKDFYPFWILNNCAQI